MLVQYRRLIILLLPLLWSLPAGAQRLTVAGIDSSGFPLLRASIYALDSAGRQIPGLGRSTFLLRENGSELEVTSYDCPLPDTDAAISSVLAIDVSGSMLRAGRGAGGTPNIELARAAAMAWINALPLDSSECAVTTFDDRGLVNTDFTNDRERLLEALAMLRPYGGTNYDAGLVTAPAGALAVARSGAHKRVIIFLTDGRGSGNEREIIETARQIDATIYCVTLGMHTPGILRRIARETGGEYFENVSTVAEAAGIYRAILFEARGGRPCRISWRSAPGCLAERRIAVSIRGSSEIATARYTAPRESIGRLDIDPPAVNFGPVTAGETREHQVTITAVNQPVMIYKLVPQDRRNGTFTLVGATAPFKLESGERRVLTVRFTASDTGYAYARFKLLSDACAGRSIFASGGSGGTPVPSIRLVAPDGGERLHPGETTTIEWDGVRYNDPVRIEYSTDNGRRWSTIAERATGLLYPWRVPPTPSDSCLARVRGLSSRILSGPTGIELSGHTDVVLSSSFSPDGAKIVSASWDGTARIWDARSGRELRALSASSRSSSARLNRVYYAEFGPDGRSVLTAHDAGQVRIWDAGTGKLLRTIEGRPFNKTDAGGLAGDGDATPAPAFSPDGGRLLLLTEGVPVVWDVTNGRRVCELHGHDDDVNAAAFSPDGSRVATASEDGTSRIWNAATGQETLRLANGRAPATSIAWSPDGRLVATIVSDGATGRIVVSNAATGAIVQTLEVPIRGLY